MVCLFLTTTVSIGCWNIGNETTRQAVLMMMHENYQAKGIPNTAWMNALLNGIHCEKNPLIASTLTNYLSSPLQEISSAERDKIENELYKLSHSHPITPSDYRSSKSDYDSVPLFLMGNRKSPTIK